MADDVNQPEHYRQGEIDCIQAQEAASTREEFLGHLRLTALKYIWRCNYKDTPQKNMEKALWYIQRYLNVVKTPTSQDSTFTGVPYCGFKGCTDHLSDVPSYHTGMVAEIDFETGTMTIEDIDNLCDK